MSRDPYSTSDYVHDATERIIKRLADVTAHDRNHASIIEVGKALIDAVLVLAGAVADVADVNRNRD